MDHKHIVTIEQSTQFAKTFGVSLSQFWRGLGLGFDIIAFDAWIGAGNRCLKTVVVEKYGEGAAGLIRELCHTRILERG